MPGIYLQQGMIETGQTPTNYRNIVVTGSNQLNLPVGIFLAESGYDYAYFNEETVSKTYLVKSGDVLALNCTYLGQFKQDAFSTTAKVTCNASDLASGERIYSGAGEYMGSSLADDLTGAVKAALSSFPSRTGYGSNVNLFRLPRRENVKSSSKNNGRYMPSIPSHASSSNSYYGSYGGGGGCGSRGGSGWRKANGKCASWRD